MVRLGQKPALIVIDMQNGFCDPGGFMNKIGLDYTTSAEAIEPISRLLAAARRAGIPIFFTRYSLNADYSDAGLLLDLFPAIKEAGGMIRGTWDADIVDGLAPLDGEHVIDKTRYSAFYDTDLERQLREPGVDTLIVCGVTTNICVESTVRDAFFRDIHVIVPSDGTAAVTPELHEGALRDFEYGFGQVATVAELEEALASLPQAVAR
jgi:ureidoacrylate peracid hydrolase